MQTHSAVMAPRLRRYYIMKDFIMYRQTTPWTLAFTFQVLQRDHPAEAVQEFQDYFMGGVDGN